MVGFLITKEIILELDLEGKQDLAVYGRKKVCVSDKQPRLSKSRIYSYEGVCSKGSWKELTRISGVWTLF